MAETSARTRRAVALRRWLPGASAVLIVAGLLPVLASSPASASSNISVTTAIDETGSPSVCSLRDAVASANSNADVGGCVGAGTGPYTIDVPAGAYNLTLGELQVGTNAGSNITIAGASALSTSVNQTSSSARVFNLDPNALGSVAVSLSNLTITGGDAQAFGGGAILGGSTGDSLVLTDDVISGNGCSGYNSAAGLSWSPAGDVTITGSTFSHNTCGQAGGAVLFDSAGTLTVSGTTFSGNSAGAAGSAGGALFLGDGGGSATFSVSDSTFTGNSATSPTGIGGAIYVGSGTLTASDDRFTGNTATHGGAIGVRGGAATAQNDWWGCPTGPNTGGCDTDDASGGSLSDSPWVTLTNTATPSQVLPGGATTLTASVLQNSSGATLTSSDVAVMVGVPVSWSGATNGTLSSEQTFIQGAGTATATLTQDGSCNNTSADALVDHGPVTATALVACPDLTATKTDNVSGNAVTGQQFTYTLTVANAGVGDATFSDGQAVLLDNLALGLTYGTPTPNSAGVLCAVASDDLTCTANGALTLVPGDSFTVTLSASGPPGTYANPRPSGVCEVDPDNLIVELSQNQSCSDLVNVQAADTTTTLSALPSTSVVGQAVAFTFAVTPVAPGTGTPTGDVTVSDGTSSCTGTVAAGTCSLTLTTAGTDTFTATYPGDTGFNGSSDTVTQQVDPAATTTKLTSHVPNPSLVGEALTVHYSVKPDLPGAGTPTGTVTVGDGVNSCSGTVAAGSCLIILHTPGARTLTASYVGDGNFNGSTSAGATQTVYIAQITIGGFAFNSVVLTTSIKQKVVALAQTIKADKASAVLLTGYCNPGETCPALSQQRANTSAAYLHVQLNKLHLNVTVTAVGGKATVLVAPKGSPLNRRVVASLT